MTASRPVGIGWSIPGARGPALIAHMGGNTAAAARVALEEVPDFLEVDLWVHNGCFEARHERAMYPLPLWFEKWKLRRAPRRPFTLADLLSETAGKAGVFLDLKNGGAEAARLVREALDVAGLADPHVVASSQHWHILRHVKELAPEVDLFYSIDVPERLDLFLSVAERDLQPAGVSCRDALLTQEAVSALHRRSMKAVAWTVDDPDRAVELAAWGVDGITTHRVAVLRNRLRPDA